MCAPKRVVAAWAKINRIRTLVKGQFLFCISAWQANKMTTKVEWATYLPKNQARYLPYLLCLSGDFVFKYLYQ